MSAIDPITLAGMWITLAGLVMWLASDLLKGKRAKANRLRRQ